MSMKKSILKNPAFWIVFATALICSAILICVLADFSSTDSGDIDGMNYYDKVEFDIDSDGTTETCYIGAGYTSGLFTFFVDAVHDGQIEYSNVFSSPFLYMSFVRNSQGELFIRGDRQLSGEVCLIDVDFDKENGEILLSSDEVEISCLGSWKIISPIPIE